MMIGENEDHSDESLPIMSIHSHNSCVDFSFLTESANCNTRKLTRLNGLFHYMADRRTGGLRADKLHDLIISAGCSEYTTRRLESFLFPKLKADGVEVLKKQRRLFGMSEKLEVDVRVISRGPFLSIFKDETMQSINNLVQSAVAIRAKKVQWRLDRSDQSSSCSQEGTLDLRIALKDSRTVKTEPALISSSNWKNIRAPEVQRQKMTNIMQNEDISETKQFSKTNEKSPRKIKHEHSQLQIDSSDDSVNKAQLRKKNLSKKKKKSTRSKDQQIEKYIQKKNENNFFHNYYSNNDVFLTQRNVGSNYIYSSNDQAVHQESKDCYGNHSNRNLGYAGKNGIMGRKYSYVVDNCMEVNQYPISIDDKLWRNMLVQQRYQMLERRRREANGDICFFGGFANFVKTLLAPRNDIIH